jgi:hypothetical protein
MRSLLVTLEIIENGKSNKKPKASGSGEKKAGENKGGILKKDGKRSVSFGEERVPKKARTEKFCDLCKKHGGAHATYNTGDCKKYEKGGALKKGFKPKGKSDRNENFTQIMKDGFKKVTKAFKKDLKKASKNDKKHKQDSEDSDSF